ncbi:MAG: class I SAM-dependent methyltransferase [Myxococcales bacterium]|nr:class I SAM-dependent methyltransferase [Myxococcales bacterium]
MKPDAPPRDSGSGFANRAYYDDFSAGYEDARGQGYHKLLDDLEVAVLAPLCKGRRVLEAGCGTGLILSRLTDQASEAYGFDLSPGMVARARSRGLRVTLGSVTAIPFADASFDVVCCFKVLPHVPEIETALRELMRVTRPGGRLVLEFYNPMSLRYLAKRIAGPQPISAKRSEADVFTRWDTPWAVARRLPEGAIFEGFRGVRVLTPAAAVHRLPIVGPALALGERLALDSPLRYFGGFLIAILRKAV